MYRQITTVMYVQNKESGAVKIVKVGQATVFSDEVPGYGCQNCRKRQESAGSARKGFREIQPG